MAKIIRPNGVSTHIELPALSEDIQIPRLGLIERRVVQDVKSIPMESTMLDVLTAQAIFGVVARAYNDYPSL